MEPKYETRPAFTVVGMLYRGKNENDEIPALWGQFIPRIGEIEGMVGGDVCYGCMRGDTDPAGTFEYLASVQVDGTGAVPDGMVRWEVAANTYAVFPTTLPKLHDTFTLAYRDWLPTSNKTRAEGTEFELYTTEFDPEDPTSTFFFCLPVE